MGVLGVEVALGILLAEAGVLGRSDRQTSTEGMELQAPVVEVGVRGPLPLVGMQQGLCMEREVFRMVVMEGIALGRAGRPGLVRFREEVEGASSTLWQMAGRGPKGRFG